MNAGSYVGNLARSPSDEELTTLFSQGGGVSAAEMIKDPDSGQSTGFSFVTRRDESDAEKAMSTFNVSR